MKVEIIEGEAKPIVSRPFRALFTGGAGPLKTSIVISEVVMLVGGRINDFVDAKLMSVLNPISKAAAIAAPICGFPDAVKFATDAVRDAKKMFKKHSWSNFHEFSHSMVNIAQRISEFAVGLIRLELVGNIAQMFFFKGLKSGLQIVHNIYVIREVNLSDGKLGNIESREVRDLKGQENNAKIVRAIVNFCYHSLVISSVLFAGVVTGKMMLGFGTISLIFGVVAHYRECAREDLESKLDATRVNKLIEKAGGWHAA